MLVQQHGETLDGQHGTANEQCRADLDNGTDAAHDCESFTGLHSYQHAPAPSQTWTSEQMCSLVPLGHEPDVGAGEQLPDAVAVGGEQHHSVETGSGKGLSSHESTGDVWSVKTVRMVRMMSVSMVGSQSL